MLKSDSHISIFENHAGKISSIQPRGEFCCNCHNMPAVIRINNSDYCRFCEKDITGKMRSI